MKGQNEIKAEEDVRRVIHNDVWMMDILREVAALQLPDSWVCAGFVRSKIWDLLHGYTTPTPLPDVDVVYYDASDLAESVEKRLEETLRAALPHVPWSVKNQARMHLVSHVPQYRSSLDALSKFPETPTAIGVRLSESHQLELAAPYGVKDLVTLVVRPTPLFDGRDDERAQTYVKRIHSKEWTTRWPRLQIVMPGDS